MADQDKNHLEVELRETKNLLTTAQTTVETLQSEREEYLDQINKLQEALQQTEEEIKEIKESHLEVIIRAGQMREDLKRDTRGNLARDRHIRVVLQQSELGRILLYLVDYFENTKKRTLTLGTLSTEVGIAPIICRTHLRHLHELAVCDFNEVSGNSPDKGGGDTPFPYIYYYPYPKGPPVASAEAIPKKVMCPSCEGIFDYTKKSCPKCGYCLEEA